MPVPDNASVMVPAPVAMLSTPERATLLVGANFTVVAQVALAARLVPHVVDTKLKSVPVTDAAVGAVTAMLARPVLVSVAVPVVLVDTFKLPNATLLRVAVAAWPVPARLTLAIPPPL